MPLPEKICVSCGKRFTLLPNKPGLANTCPQCSAPPVEIAVVERKPRKPYPATALPFAAFEKWAKRRPVPLLQELDSGAHLRRFNLIPVFRNNGKLHAQGPQDRIDGLKARVCACTQGFVQALPAKS